MPNFGHNTGQATLFLLLDLVNTVSSNTSAEGQQVHDVVVQGAVDSLRDVVGDTGLEAGVTVEQQECRQTGIENDGGGGCERSGNQWDQTDSNKSFGGPVQRAMALLCFRWHVGVVDSAHDVSWWLWDGLDSTSKRGLKERGGGRQSQ